MPNVASLEGGGLQDHTDRFGSKKLLHIQHAVSERVVMQQQPAVVSELLVSDMAHARKDVPSLLNNSACLVLVPSETSSRWIIPPPAPKKNSALS